MQRKGASLDHVKEQGKLVAQVLKERQSAKDWEENWGFLKEKKKFLEDEAAALGWTKEEYWAAVKSLESARVIKNPSSIVTLPTVKSFPETSNGVYGWRCEIALDMNIRPPIPVFPKPEAQNVIFLG